MAANNPYEQYKSSTVLTASKEELTLMLYEGALKFCNQSIAAIESKDYSRANELIIRVQDIIREFQFTLNHSYEISKSFNELYAYIIERLIDANIKKDIEILEEVRGYLREFRDMWKEAMRISRQTPAAAAKTAASSGSYYN